MTDDVTAGRPPVVEMHVCVPDTAGQCTLPSHYAHGSAVVPDEAYNAATTAVHEKIRADVAMAQTVYEASLIEAAVSAAAPLIAAAERERTQRGIADAIKDNPGPDPSPASPVWWAGWREGRDDAERIARDYTPADSGTDTSGRTDG